MWLVIEGAPRTKKNSQRIVRMGRRSAIVQSRQYLEWEGPALLQLMSQERGARRSARQADVLRAPLSSEPVNMCAIVYRDRRVGDLLNYLAAISDVLERAGIVDNDKLIVTVDGSRMRHDKKRPRVEITLTPARVDFGYP